jgi:hypothetical protein
MSVAFSSLSAVCLSCPISPSSVATLEVSHTHTKEPRTLIRLQPDIIMAKLSQLSTTLPAVSNEPSQESSLAHAKESVPDGQSWTSSGLFGTFHYSKRRYSMIKGRYSDEPSRREERDEIIARYCAPAWLANRAWSIQALHASSGWTFSPRSYSIIPSNSIIFQYLRNGNVGGIRSFSNDVKLLHSIAMSLVTQFWTYVPLLLYAMKQASVRLTAV